MDGARGWCEEPRTHTATSPAHLRRYDVFQLGGTAGGFRDARLEMMYSCPSRRDTSLQGLPLVHFSAHHPEPFLSLKRFKHPAYPARSAHVKPKSGRV